jgi:hypothetical protein
MNLPTLIKNLYGNLVFTGLYSFEFVDKNKNTITEIFFMCPPKRKSVEEPTRSTTVPTLGGNYNNDAGNATKNITISGDLFFQYIGSPDNPIARFNTDLENQIDGLNEFFKLRWMLISYRDYTLTPNAKLKSPTALMNLSGEIASLYSAVSERLSKKAGALYDEIQLIFHDYDMDDHYYCRVDNFSSNQDDTRYNAINYTINIECYEPNSKQIFKSQTKKPTNELVNIISNQITDLNFDGKLEDIQDEIGYNIDFLLTSLTIQNVLDSIQTENDAIQAGESTASTLLPDLTSTLLESNTTALTEFISTFLSPAQKTLYDTGDLSFESVIGIDLMIFYNVLQKITLIGNSLQGVLNSIIQQEELRYYSNADKYTITEEQFDEDDDNKVENDISFYFYTVQKGDTAKIIANRELQDPEKAANILQINNITENDFIDETIIGDKIKIPILGAALARGDDNLVYETDQTNTEKFLYGTDLKTGINDELLLSADGDLRSFTGADVVVANLEKRITRRKGSLNIFHPGWGTNPVDDGNAPLMVRIERYLNDLSEQINSDPRVNYSKLNLEKLQFEGETLTNSTEVFLIGAEESREVSA